jgi:dihydrofolate reductase
LPLASRLALTYVRKRVEGDAHFPVIEAGVWREVAREEHAAAVGDDAPFAFVTYERLAAASPAAKAP